ncbi:MAG: YabP/YqfC family sporulation protein [Oscillospiraceae bacterium]|nr:YabP/YqfC family sporulation protein [Oscillospiraceae bacterium]
MSNLMHTLELTGRTKMVLTEIVDVKSFDETSIVCKTEEEAIQIMGENLHIDTLDLDSGRLVISGLISAFKYSGAYAVKGTFWEKVFK